MTVVPLFSIFSLLLLCVNTQNPVYSVKLDGAEVINFLSPTGLSYASNLQMDMNSTSDDVYTLYFTAGRQFPNLYTAQFQTLPTYIDKKFWATGVPIQTTASPFLTFSVLGNNILGPAFPSANNVASFVIQSVYLGTTVSVAQYNITGINFVATIISPDVDPGTGNHFVYLVGWDIEANIVIARATIKPNQNDAAFQLNMADDVLSIPLTDPCYDQFDEVVHPQIYLTPNEIVVLIPKRCSLFVKVTLPPEPLINFNTATFVWFSPASAAANSIYVSSAVFDPDYSVIFYTLKTYNTPGANLYSFDTTKWIANPFETELDLIEAENLLVLGVEKDPTKTTRYIFIVASGANKVQRLTIANNNTFNTLTAAALSPLFNRISSAWYFRPSLYFTTYEPDAKLGRITKANFCKDWCGDYGYCTNGYCSCREGYTFDGTDVTNLCVPESLVYEKEKEKETQGAAATLGVLFAFSLLAAIAGWVMWWRTRKLHKLPGSY